MRKLKKFIDLLPLFILWAMLSALLWGFVFTRITDTDRTEKLVLCVDAQVPGGSEIALEIKKGAGENIRLVRARPFDYAMMDARTLEEADLYLIPEDRLETYRDWLLPLPDSLRAAGPVREADGVPVGTLARDAVTGQAVFSGWIRYRDDTDYYLCLGRKSLHVAGLNGAVDNEAEAAALRILNQAEQNAADQTGKE